MNNLEMQIDPPTSFDELSSRLRSLFEFRQLKNASDTDEELQTLALQAVDPERGHMVEADLCSMAWDRLISEADGRSEFMQRVFVVDTCCDIVGGTRSIRYIKLKIRYAFA